MHYHCIYEMIFGRKQCSFLPVYRLDYLKIYEPIINDDISF